MNKKLKIVKKQTKQPIETNMKCPTCGTEIDVLGIKQAIKNRIDQELDYILENI